MKKAKATDKEFRTHIAEPRWQQVCSLLVVAVLVVAWVWVISRK